MREKKFSRQATAFPIILFIVVYCCACDWRVKIGYTVSNIIFFENIDIKSFARIDITIRHFEYSHLSRLFNMYSTTYAKLHYVTVRNSLTAITELFDSKQYCSNTCFCISIFVSFIKLKRDNDFPFVWISVSV